MENIVDSYEKLKVLLESIELDIHKSARGNKSAGVRVRKGLRLLKREATDLVKSSLEASKS
jgi:hypothetical protein|tara:strand:- start:44 stop:226 length:183 start_codon:yes stop_codon:yes gene_type:complete